MKNFKNNITAFTLGVLLATFGTMGFYIFFNDNDEKTAKINELTQTLELMNSACLEVAQKAWVNEGMYLSESYKTSLLEGHGGFNEDARFQIDSMKQVFFKEWSNNNRGPKQKILDELVKMGTPIK